ncbi:vesicular glutamate transporter 1 [Plutella xylostella]|uniref:vesicular glutamate transporter 1 n=1 Tax=Plutella xylostella TaxID=51655 RepID=UPI0005D098CD|nr:vesicular glutamate transporter 1 [Plutella xylostella]
MAVIVLKFLDVVPARLNLWVMMFTACWASYMLRVNMSMNIIAMVPQLPRNDTAHASQCGTPPDALISNQTIMLHEDISDVRQAPRPVPQLASFNWTADQQALILGSYFWSYPVTSLLGGPAAERWGPRYVVLISMVAGSLLTMVSPAAARLHYIALILVRFLIGITGGFIYPALHALVARWVPPAEKGKFISAMMGGTLGTVVTWSLAGPLMERCGWAAAFYVPAALSLAWCGFWWYLVADTPADHPRISEKERNYIEDALGGKVQKSKGLPPLKSIFTSIPFLAMTVLHYGNMWGLYFIMTVGPKFVSSVLGFELSAAGVISALPYLARMLFAVMFGFVGDCILGRKMMTNTAIRKFFCTFSHILPGVLLVLLVYSGCSTALSVALITLSMGFNGAATLTNLQNHQDLAPNFAGTLYGIANFVGSTAGFFTPMITAAYTRHGNGYEQWRPVFFIGASVYIVSAIFFIIFGTADTQPWNTVPDKAGATEKSKNGELKEIKETSVTVS